MVFNHIKLLIKSTQYRIDSAVMVLLATPLGLLLVNREWIFTNAYVSFIDPWIYVGYFLNFPQHLKTFTGAYNGTRLSWILPGYYIHQVLPPLEANYVLHLAVYYGSTICLYLVLKQTLSARSGLLAAILMGLYPPFLNAVGWDYPDGAGMAYFLLSMLMLTYAAKLSHWRSLVCLGGLFAADLIFTNLYWVPFLPILAIHYIITNRENRQNPVWFSGLLFIAGMVIGTCILGIFNYTHNRNFLFFMPTINYLLAIRFNQDASYYDATYGWLSTLAFLRPIIAVCFSSISILIFYLFVKRNHAKKTSERYVLLYQINLILFALMMVFWEIKGWPAFQYFYYASSIVPSLFLALGAQLSIIVDRLTPKQFAVVVLAPFALLLPLHSQHWAYWFSNTNNLRQLLLLSTVLLLVFVGLNLFTNLRYKLTVGLVALLISALAFTSFNFTYAGLTFNASQVSSTQDGYLAIIKSVKTLQTHVPDLRKNVRQGKRLFWYDAKSKFGGMYTSIASTYMWHPLLVNEEFPSLRDVVLGTPVINLLPDTKLVLLSDQPTVVEQANTALKRINLHAQVLHQERIQAGNIDFTMTFIKTVKD